MNFYLVFALVAGLWGPWTTSFADEPLNPLRLGRSSERKHPPGLEKLAEHIEALPSVQALERALEAQRLQLSLTYQKTTVDQDRAVEALLEAAVLDMRAEIKKHQLPSDFERLLLTIWEGAWDRLNFIQLYREMKTSAVEQGAKYGAAVMLWQTTEILLYIAFPKMLFMALGPHTHDIVMSHIYYKLINGAHELRVVWQKWQANGGLVAGPRGYYQTLYEQRLISPLDWSEVLLSHGSSVILPNSPLEAITPKSLRWFFMPRRQAVRENASAFTLSELESFFPAKGSGEKSLRRILKTSPYLYAYYLVIQIYNNPRMRNEFMRQWEIKLHALPSSEATEPESGVDLNCDQIWCHENRVDVLTDQSMPEEVLLERLLAKTFRLDLMAVELHGRLKEKFRLYTAGLEGEYRLRRDFENLLSRELWPLTLKREFTTTPGLAQRLVAVAAQAHKQLEVIRALAVRQAEMARKPYGNILGLCDPVF